MYGLIRHISKLDNGQLGSAQLQSGPGLGRWSGWGGGDTEKRRMKKYILLSTLFLMKFPKLKRRDGFVMSHFFQEHAMIYGMWFVFKWAGYINRFLGLLWHGIQMSESRSWWPHGSSAIQDDPPCTPVSQHNPRVRTLLWSMKIKRNQRIK